jgi:hypothetical protein
MKGPLLNMKCACGYSEDIGVDIRSGVIVKGDITIICPKCGAIMNMANAIILSPVQFIPPNRTNVTDRGF